MNTGRHLYSLVQGTSPERATSIINHIMSLICGERYKPTVPSLGDHAKAKQKPKICEEHITHIELNMHQSNLKISFLLLSRTCLPVDIADKTTNNYSFGAFLRQNFQNIAD